MPRQVAKDCLVSYEGSRYSVPHAYAGQAVVVKVPVTGEPITIWRQQECVAAHRRALAKGQMVIDTAHYAGLPRRSFAPPPGSPLIPATVVLPAGPGVGAAHHAPHVENRPLAIYEFCCGEQVGHVAAS